MARVETTVYNRCANCHDFLYLNSSYRLLRPFDCHSKSIITFAHSKTIHLNSGSQATINTTAHHTIPLQPSLLARIPPPAVYAPLFIWLTRHHFPLRRSTPHPSPPHPHPLAQITQPKRHDHDPAHAQPTLISIPLPRCQVAEVTDHDIMRQRFWRDEVRRSDCPWYQPHRRSWHYELLLQLPLIRTVVWIRKPGVSAAAVVPPQRIAVGFQCPHDRRGQ